VIIEHPDITAYFARVFADDWDAAAADGTVAEGPDRLKVVAAACILAALMGLYIYRRRRT